MGLLDRLLGRSVGPQTDWIGKTALLELLAGASPPRIIDVRSPAEFIGPLGHIDSAENLPLDHFDGQIEALLEDTRTLVMVCHTDRRSSAAAQRLRQAGRTNVTVLRGGMVAWRS